MLLVEAKFSKSIDAMSSLFLSLLCSFKWWPQSAATVKSFGGSARFRKQDGVSLYFLMLGEAKF